MMSWKGLIAGTFLVLSVNALAEQVQIASGELENLGVRFAPPQPATDFTGFETTAHVAIPPDNEAVVGVPHEGLLTGLRAAIGDEVDQGAVLAELSSPGFIELQREFLDALNTHLLARNELDRDQQLHAEGIISARRLQETGTRSRIAETRLNEHKQLLGMAGLSSQEIDNLEQTGVLIGSLKIRAPFDGVVIERMATTGQRLEAMAPVYRIADLASLWLEIDVPQERAGAVRPGMRVALASSVEGHVGTVTAISRAIDAATQFVTVRANLDSNDAGLRPGQFVAVRLLAEVSDVSADSVWVSDASAVFRSGNSNYAFVRNELGVDVIPVRVIGSNAGVTYFIARISSGDMIAVSGVSALKALWSAQDDSGL